MTRKKVAGSPPNYAEHRGRWSGLIHDIHHAVASGDASSLNSLASRANAAETCWTMVAPYPRGLMCRVMARTAYAWSRQTDPETRAKLTPLMMDAVALVDGLLAETATAPVAPLPGVTPTGEPVGGRLPYADA